MDNKKFKLFIEITISDNKGSFETIVVPYKNDIYDTKDYKYPISDFEKIDVRIEVESEYNYIKFFKDNRLYAELSELHLNESKVVTADEFNVFAVLKVYEFKQGKYVAAFKIDYYSMGIVELEDYLKLVYKVDHDALRFLAINFYINDKSYRDLTLAKEILESPIFENDEEARYYLFKAILLERFEGNYPDIISNIEHISYNYEHLFLPLLSNGYELALFGEEDIKEEIFDYYSRLIRNNYDDLERSRRQAQNIIPYNSFILAYEDNEGNLTSGDIELVKLDYKALPVFEPNVDDKKIVILSYVYINNELAKCRTILNEEVELASDDSLNVQIIETVLLSPVGIPDDVLGTMKAYVAWYKKKIFFEKEYDSLY